ncbi:hypothetical protein ASG31_05855 [Chryseobacterium sp. Leaf404]|uniref:DUF922 domain-containing protein n=1 Tax=unclassified Chryseobacterium TaxID=2593645 RepID=UPI000701F236|nr:MULTISPECIES: hypothetical protein [unclassified Chryseobacterium]KQT18250.1 hypothetical protein ASG31_05855 [Chryseobacterium sp. Leaf404]
MKYRFSAFLLLISFVFISAQKIYWSEGRKLTWEDFQSDNNKDKDSSVVAFANVGMGYKAETTTDPKAPVTIKVLVFFDVQKSWKVDGITGEWTLNHEQLHFDIAELYGRILRKKIFDEIKNSKDYQTKFEEIYKSNLAEYKRFQRLYDKESNHGIDEEKQLFYNKTVAEELKKLDKYRSH